MKTDFPFALLVAGLACLSAIPAPAGMTITRLPGAPAGPQVLVSHPLFDSGGNTSIRYYPRLERDLKHDTVLNRHYYNRDRDLGQTFRVGAQGFWLNAITIRTGFGSLPFRAGAAGAEMYLQIMRVEGTPVLNNHGTTSNPPGARWQTFNPNDPTTDDYLTGETYTHVRVIRGATMPDLTPFKWNPSGAPGNGQFVRWELTGADEVWLQPNTTYAFFMGFAAPGAERAMTFANQFRGSDAGGHGIRREGSAELPAFYNPAEVNALSDKIFVANTNDVADNTAALDIATFADDFTLRVRDMDFGTMGMPDVCTYRDLTFYIEGRAEDPPPPDDPPTGSIHNSPNPPAANVVFQGATDGTGINVRWRAGGTDQDNGSTFRMGSETRTLEAITVRIHPNNFGANVPGSPVVLHFFSWDGASLPNSFTPLWGFTNHLPLTTAPNDYIRWDVRGQNQTLAAGAYYGFVLGAAVEDPASGPNIFRLYDAASDVVPDAFEVRRDYEFGSVSRPNYTVAPDARTDRDLLFYVEAVAPPSRITQWAWQPDGHLRLTATGHDGGSYVLDATAGLTAPILWQPVATNTVVGGMVEYPDLPVTPPQRFYRLRRVR